MTRSILLGCAALVVVLSTTPAWGQAADPGINANNARNRIAAATALPTKRTADGRPNLSGVWENGFTIAQAVVDPKGDICIIGCDLRANEAPPGFRRLADGGRPADQQRPLDLPKYKPEQAAKVEFLKKNQVDLDPIYHCIPLGVPRSGPPTKIVQTPTELIFLYTALSNAWRIIPIDGRPHREDADPSAYGDAVGHWEGDTMVIESTNFDETTWLANNGSFHTANMKVIERFTPMGGALRYERIVYDPEVLAEPWKAEPMTIVPAAQNPVEEPPCMEQSSKHMVSKEFYQEGRVGVR